MNERVGQSPWVERVIVVVAVLVTVVVLGWFVWDNRQDGAREDCLKEQFTDALLERPVRDC